jgi:dTDP-4-amino-4,6-dideoxygalactose transaminase
VIWRCDLTPQYLEMKSEIDEAMQRVLHSGRYVLADEGRAFEEEFARYLGVKHAVGVNSGTDAIMMALWALGVEPGDEIITTPFTAIPTYSAIRHVGATAVFVDIDPHTFLMDLDLVAAAITPRTRAVVPVHLFGNLIDIPRLRGIVGPRIRIMEDCAQSHGATLGGAQSGSFGDAAAFSFYPTKNLGAIGEGGAVTTNDAEVADRVRRLRDHGQAGRHEHVDIAYNARLDSVQCACLEISLKRLPAATAARRAAAKRYRYKLLDSVRYVTEAVDSAPVYHLMIIRVDAAKRDAIRDRLGKAGVATAIHYPTPIHLQPAYAHLGQGPGSCPVAERSVREMISLPMFPDITEAQIDYVCTEVLAALAER